MKVKSVIPGLLLLGAVVLLSGCATIPGGIAASNTPLHDREYMVVAPVQNTSSRVYLLGFIPITSANNTRRAIQSAIRKHDGDAMTEITVEHYAQSWILFSRYVTRVEGNVVRFVR
jgi:starvation-inducible outer membrane lipoprotein